MEYGEVVPNGIADVLGALGELEEEPKAIRQVGKFQLNKETIFCRLPSFVDPMPDNIVVGDIGMFGIEDALASFDESPIIDGATRIVGASDPRCAASGAIKHVAFWKLNRRGRPHDLAIAAWQGSSQIVVALGRDLDPADPASWGDLPYRKGGPRFEDILIPDLEVLSSKTLEIILSDREQTQ